MKKLNALFLVAGASVLFAREACNGSNATQAATQVTEKSQETTNSKVRKVLDNRPNSASVDEIPSVAMTEEEAQADLKNRCKFEQNGNSIDFTYDCEQFEGKARTLFNRTLAQVQESGSLAELEPFEACSDFHWLVGSENRSAYDMLAAPAPHSHFKLDDWRCVAGIYIYTNDATKVIDCKVTTTCADGDGSRQVLGSYLTEDCTKKGVNAVAALHELDEALSMESSEK